MKTATISSSPRKTPVQSRSRERVERILDAAAHVFAEVGYEATTTEAIAERAGASIGSLYQFFPNKQSLFDAVAKRHLEHASTLFDALLGAADTGATWQDVLDRAIDGFAALDVGDPNLRAVWRNWHVAGSFLDAGDALNREFARRTQAVLARHARGLPKGKRELVATMIVEVISAMLFVAARKRGPGVRALLDETKVMLGRYLEPYARAHAPRAGRGRKTPHR
jgi:AcrR family transcriptional regulator